MGFRQATEAIHLSIFTEKYLQQQTLLCAQSHTRTFKQSESSNILDLNFLACRLKAFEKF